MSGHKQGEFKASDLVLDGDQKRVMLSALLIILSTMVFAWYVTSTQKKKPEPGGAAAGGKNQPFLNKERQTVALLEKIVLSPDTRLFRFALPKHAPVLGLPVGKHFKVWASNPNKTSSTWNNQPDAEAGKLEIERKYTPTSSDDDVGHFDLVIKVYFGNKVDKFPDGGKMSQCFEELRIGSTIDLAGPFGLIEYCGQGLFRNKGKDVRVRHIGMLAGGTGVTPMLQVIEAVLKDAHDPTTVSLVFANQTEEDILLRRRLDQLAAHDKRFKVWYSLDRPPANWKFSSGFVNKEMCAEHLPASGTDVVVLMCGPPPMLKFACKPALEALGHAKEMQWEF